MQVDELLRTMMTLGASDLHLKPSRPPLIRVNGDIQPLDGSSTLAPEDIGKMLSSILQPHQKARLEKDLSVDLGYGVPGVARFRCNIYLQRGTLAASFRLVPYEVLDIGTLDLPEILYDFCNLKTGMVLVTGPTGSGKSTTLAAMLKHIIQTRAVNVITIEDPMEFLMADGLATISQREVGTDTPSFPEALRNAMRQDPDIIMVGEMRDPETISTVITAAETGHVCFSTLHTNSAGQTIDRILDSFPSGQQAQIRSQLSQVLAAVVSIKLVPTKDGAGRVAALEILRNTPKIAKMIDTGNVAEIREEIESSVAHYRMQSTNQSLMALLVHGTISYEEAMKQSTDPEDLSLKLRSMFPNIEENKGVDMSDADFSEILQLQQFKRLYEEQETSFQSQMGDKDQEIMSLRSAVGDRDAEIQSLHQHLQEHQEDMERMRTDFGRLKVEAQEKIDKLMERIKELNQRLVGA
jgi:twitching motility protein PilT